MVGELGQLSGRFWEVSSVRRTGAGARGNRRHYFEIALRKRDRLTDFKENFERGFWRLENVERRTDA